MQDFFSDQIDLHVHTNFSDGAVSPAQIVARARGLGLAAISITDHDTADGCREAMHLAGNTRGFDIVPGIEFTTSCDGWDSDIHLLGYYMALNHRYLHMLELQATHDLHHRVQECLDSLGKVGFRLTMKDVFRENPRYGGGISVIMAIWRKGYVKTYRHAMELYYRHWGKISPSEISLRDAINVIHRCGGVAVLAHPNKLTVGGKPLGDGEIKTLAEWGLDGLETYHPSYQDDALQEKFSQLAARHGLLVTGGSDEHARGYLPEGPPPEKVPVGYSWMGKMYVPVQLLYVLQDRTKRYRRRRTRTVPRDEPTE